MLPVHIIIDSIPSVWLWLECSLADREVAGLMPSCCCKEPYSYCSSPPSCINGDQAIAGEANTKLCMSHLMVEAQVGPWVPILSSMRHAYPSCWVLAPSPGGFVLHRPRSTCLVHRPACLGRRDHVKGGYRLFCFCFVCVCAYVYMHVHMCAHMCVCLCICYTRS